MSVNSIDKTRSFKKSKVVKKRVVESANDAWERIVGSLPKEAEEGKTTQELSEEIKRPKNWVRDNILAPLKQAGRLVVSFRRDEGLDGRIISKPVYKVKNK